MIKKILLNAFASIMAQGYRSMAKSSKFEEQSNCNISKSDVSKL